METCAKLWKFSTQIVFIYKFIAPTPIIPISVMVSMCRIEQELNDTKRLLPSFYARFYSIVYFAILMFFFYIAFVSKFYKPTKKNLRAF